MSDDGPESNADDGFEVEVVPALYGIAGRWFLEVVRGIGPEQWTEPGLGEWTVRELVGHAARAFSTVSEYTFDGAEAEVVEVEIDDVLEYFRAALTVPDIHAGVLTRGREAGAALSIDPSEIVAEIESIVAAAMAVVDGASLDAKSRTFAGVMWLVDFLDTRLVEAIVHTLDLCAATGQPLVPPAGPGQRVLDILSAFVRPDDRGAVILALAGRRPLPIAYTTLA